MRKTILILLSALILLVSFSSCSEDPRVAPTRVFIVSVNGEKIEVKLNDDIRFVTIGIWETVSLDAVTNRVPTGAKLRWSSFDSNIVSVDENGLCTGLALGASLISVALDGGDEQAVCVVRVVADPDHIPDSNGISSIEIINLTDLITRDVLAIDNGTPTIKASSLDSLREINFPVSCEITDIDYPGYTADYLWYLDGVLLSDKTGKTEIFNFAEYGSYLIEVQPMIHVPGVDAPIPAKQGSIKVNVVPR